MDAHSTPAAPSQAAASLQDKPPNARTWRAASARFAEVPALAASLRQLLYLRSVAIAGQATAVGIALWLGVALPVVPIVVVIAVLVAMNVLTASRLKRGTPVTHSEVAVHLGFDLAAFSTLLLLAGGTANPFGLLYLLHVVLIALLLPWWFALAGTLLVVASFALAFRFAAPLRYTTGEVLPDTLMALGLWVSFALTATVTAWFVGGIVAARREGERLLRDAERRALNDEAVLRLGALAAGAAHELGTPLTTMGVVVGEMRREADTPERQRDVAILGAQIDACRRALANLRAAAGHACAVGGGRVAVDGFLAEVAARFCAMRPEVQLEARWEGTGPAPEIFADASLPQAILILLNNAADASSHHVDLHGRWDPDWLMIAVGDRGAGVPEGSLDKLGRVFFTTKRPGKGTGLGLVLAASTVTRLGGTIRWTNRADGGLFAELRLPLQGLTISRQTE